MKRWKTVEQWFGKIFNTERTPMSGSNSKITSSDTIHHKLYMEVKTSEGWSELGEYYEYYNNSERFFAINIFNNIIMLNTVDMYCDLKILPTNKKHKAILGRWYETVCKAQKENKIPMICIKPRQKRLINKFGKWIKGGWIICDKTQLSEILLESSGEHRKNPT